MAQMYAATVGLFYEESKSSAEGLNDLVKEYRSNTVVVLAFATGAATFFGFDKSAKGPFYVAALVAYAVAVLASAKIFWPKGWLTNPASNYQNVLQSSSPITLVEAQFDLAKSHQTMFRRNSSTLRSIARWFRVVLCLSGLVVIFAGINSVRSQPEVPDKPTRVIIERGP
jgi:hypothetical protein